MHYTKTIFNIQYVLDVEMIDNSLNERIDSDDIDHIM
jgi:hypothetical protein